MKDAAMNGLAPMRYSSNISVIKSFFFITNHNVYAWPAFSCCCRSELTPVSERKDQNPYRKLVRVTIRSYNISVINLNSSILLPFPFRGMGRMRPYPDLRGHRVRGGPMGMGPPPPPPPPHLRGPFPPIPR